MSGWPRRISALVVAGALGVGVSCTSPDALGPWNSSAPQASLILGDELHLLGCSTQPYELVTSIVGPAGGTIAIGAHRLVIPPGALAAEHAIRAEQVPYQVNSVRFSPDGLEFATPATLTLSYANCSPRTLRKRVVYTDESLRILEHVPSLDDLRARSVTGEIRHFSRYAVAW
jgi:hypothetical protein